MVSSLRCRRQAPEGGIRECGMDRLVEESDILVHAPGVLARQCALLLEDDVVVLAALDRVERFSGVPVPAQRCATGADKAELEALAPGRRQLPDQAGQIVLRGL